MSHPGQQIVHEARRWVGTPFRHQGRMLGAGVDCVGLLIGVARGLGLPEPAEVPYVMRGRPGQLREWLDGQFERRLLRRPGDVLLMNIARLECHVLIYCGHNPATRTHTVIHAGARGCVEHTLAPKWRERIAAVYGYRHV